MSAVFGNVGEDFRPSSGDDFFVPNYAKRQKDEYGYKVFADTKFLVVREQLLFEAMSRGQSYWMGPLNVNLVPLSEQRIFANGRGAHVKYENVVIGELTAFELERRPQLLRNIEQGLSFRGAIEDDLIGCVLKIFTRYTGTLS